MPAAQHFGCRAGVGVTYFDLIPRRPAIDRIEIISEGSPAVYGSRRSPGGVNIIRRATYVDRGEGASMGCPRSPCDRSRLSMGERGEKGAVRHNASYLTRTERRVRSWMTATTINSYGGRTRPFTCAQIQAHIFPSMGAITRQSALPPRRSRGIHRNPRRLEVCSRRGRPSCSLLGQFPIWALSDLLSS